MPTTIGRAIEACAPLEPVTRFGNGFAQQAQGWKLILTPTFQNIETGSRPSSSVNRFIRLHPPASKTSTYAYTCAA